MLLTSGASHTTGAEESDVIHGWLAMKAKEPPLRKASPTCATTRQSAPTISTVSPVVRA